MLARLILRHGYLLIFAGVALEGDATLATAAFLAHRGEFSLAYVIATAMVAATFGNEVVFWIFNGRGHAFADRLAAKDRRFARAEEWVRKRGGLLLFLSRFIIGFRTAIPAACAVSGMPAARFFFFNASGAIVWTLVFAYIGFAGTYEIRRLVREIRLHEVPIGAFLVFLLAGYVLIRGREKTPPSTDG